MRPWKLWILLLFFCSTGWAQRSVTFKYEGVQQSDIQAIERSTPQIFSRPSLYHMDQLVRSLMATGNYSSVEIYEDSGSLVVVGLALQTVTEVRISGNSILSTADILERSGLIEGHKIGHDQIIQARQSIEKYMTEKGFFGFSLDFKVVPVGQGRVRVDIQVTEGTRALIEDLEIKTNNERLSQRLQRSLQRFRGRPLTETQLFEIRQTLTRFLNRHRYLSARLSEPSVEMNEDQSKALLIYAIERADRFEFFMSGNTEFSSQYLIRRFELDQQTSATVSPATEFSNRIRETYLKKGFAHVNVTFDERVNSEAFSHRIYFNINEGPKVKVREYNFNGKFTRPPNVYASLLKTHATGLLRGGGYNRSELEAAADGMLTDLQNQGFLSAQVLALRPEYNEAGDQVTIHVLLDEGPQTFLQKIEFVNNKAFTASTLNSAISLEVSRPLSLIELEESLAALYVFYTDRGYLDFQVANVDEDIITYSAGNTLASVKFVLSEGPMVTVKNIQVEGNTFTKDYVVVNELDFELGEVLTPDNLSESIFRLQRLGIFSGVDIDTVERGTEVSDRTVQVQVTEREPGTFSAGLGFTNQYDLTYRGFVGVAYRNLFGTARSISTRVDAQYSQDPEIQYFENRINFSYLEPYVFHKRTKARFVLERSEEVYQPTTPVRIQERLEARTNFEHEFSRRVKFIWNAYTFSNQRTFGRRHPRDESTLNIGSLGPLLELDFRNDLVNPSSGTLSRFDVEYASPELGSTDNDTNSIKFIRTTASVTGYTPLKRNGIVWVNTLRGGYLKNLSTKDVGGVPAVKAFFLGGQTTIRGFDAKHERFPQPRELNDPNDPDADDLSRYFLPTESHFYLIKSELRVPIVGNLGASLFYDGGAVMILGQPFPDPYRDAVGVGIRYTTPVGAVALEIGKKLDRKPERNESDFAFHISIGSF